MAILHLPQLNFCDYYLSIKKNLRVEHKKVNLGQFTTIHTYKVMFFKFILNIVITEHYHNSTYKELFK